MPRFCWCCRRCMLIIDLPLVSYDVIFMGVAIIFLFIVVVVFAAAHARVIEVIDVVLLIFRTTKTIRLPRCNKIVTL